jgi:hypothetical protein
MNELSFFVWGDKYRKIIVDGDLVTSDTTNVLLKQMESYLRKQPKNLNKEIVI